MKAVNVITFVSGVSVVTHIFGFLSGLELGAMLLRDEVEQVEKPNSEIIWITFIFPPGLGKTCQASFVDSLLAWLWGCSWDKHRGGGELPRLLAPELLGSRMDSKQAEFWLRALI